MGTNSIIYWISNLIGDFLSLLPSMFLILIVAVVSYIFTIYNDDF